MDKLIGLLRRGLASYAKLPPSARVVIGAAMLLAGMWMMALTL